MLGSGPDIPLPCGPRETISRCSSQTPVHFLTYVLQALKFLVSMQTKNGWASKLSHFGFFAGDQVCKVVG